MDYKTVLYKNLIHNQKYLRRISKESFCVGIFKRINKHRNKGCKLFNITKNIIGTVYLDTHYFIPKICYFRICLKAFRIFLTMFTSFMSNMTTFMSSAFSTLAIESFMFTN